MGPMPASERVTIMSSQPVDVQILPAGDGDTCPCGAQARFLIVLDTYGQPTLPLPVCEEHAEKEAVEIVEALAAARDEAQN